MPFAGTLDDLICNAMLAERDAEICFSPGFRWGASLLPGAPITWDDVYNATAITYPACYRTEITGATIKSIWRMWPTTPSTPMRTIGKAGTWCGSAA